MPLFGYYGGILRLNGISYDIVSIDTKHKEFFSVLNDNPYNARIRFHYLEGMVLDNEKLLELQGLNGIFIFE